MSDFKKYIRKHFSSQKQCAVELGVTQQTVTNWMKHNPMGILKHVNFIVAKKDTTATELVSEVFHHKELLEQ